MKRLLVAAREDALKRLASANGIDVSGKAMQELVNALKGAKLVGGAQKTILDAIPRIRNMVLHADWAKISESGVGSVFGFLEQMLPTEFSPT